jgi:hypothetical protein
VGEGIRVRRGNRTEPVDPAEKWELPCTEGPQDEYFRGPLSVFPRPPRQEEDVPPGALTALQEICGIDKLSQLFLIPRSVRDLGWKGMKVVCPAAVLALGTRAVGFWTMEPEPGMKVVIRLGQLSAIEDLTILLYGRLSFLSSGERLTVRYNTLFRRQLEPTLVKFRKRLVGSPLPISRECPPAAGLPLKWRNLLLGDLVSLVEEAPVAFRFVRGSEAAGDGGKDLIIAVNPWELVYMRDPPDSIHRYGQDSIIIPRARIANVACREEALEVFANGCRLRLPMDTDLAKAAIEGLA